MDEVTAIHSDQHELCACPSMICLRSYCLSTSLIRIYRILCCGSGQWEQNWASTGPCCSHILPSNLHMPRSETHLSTKEWWWCDTPGGDKRTHKRKEVFAEAVSGTLISLLQQLQPNDKTSSLKLFHADGGVGWAAMLAGNEAMFVRDMRQSARRIAVKRGNMLIVKCYWFTNINKTLQSAVILLIPDR